MNWAHVHLILNHVPMLTLPLALLFFAHSLWKGDKDGGRFSLLVLVATAASVVPVYLTGEPAEEVIEHLAGVSETLIKAHEESAEISLILTLIAGTTALFALLVRSRANLQRVGRIAVFVSSLVATGFLSYTANLGGKIRHPETQSSLPGVSEQNAADKTKLEAEIGNEVEDDNRS